MENPLDNLTESQRTTLKQFRLNLEDILTPDHTDYALVKYLRAKNFNLKAAEKIFKENYYNRRSFGVNTMLDTYVKPQVAREYETAGILGYAKDGTLIRYTGAGRLDFYGFIMSMSCHDLCLYFSYMMESDIQMLKDHNAKTGKNIQEITYVIDLEGFTLQQIMHKCVIEMGMDYVRLLQDCYPEIWSNVLVVNTPLIFDKAFNLFKPVLRAPTLERIQLADRGSTKNLLLKYIDDNVLPAFLGGKRVDSKGDPHCKEFITFGGKVPERFYGKNTRTPISPSDPSVRHFCVPPRSMRNLSFVIHEANSKVKMQASADGSMYVSLLYRELGPDPSAIDLPQEDEYLDETADNFKYKQISVELRDQAHCTKEEFTLVMENPGIYVLRLNNSNSWFTSRKILMTCEIFPPDKESSP